MIESVKITPEILKKAGFKDQTVGWGGSQGADYVYKKNGVEIRTYDSDKYWHLSSDFNVKFEYVHQLQEIYFDLTREKLNIQL